MKIDRKPGSGILKLKAQKDDGPASRLLKLNPTERFDAAMEKHSENPAGPTFAAIREYLIGVDTTNAIARENQRARAKKPRRPHLDGLIKACLRENRDVSAREIWDSVSLYCEDGFSIKADEWTLEWDYEGDESTRGQSGSLTFSSFASRVSRIRKKLT